MTPGERLAAGWRVVAIYYRIKYHASGSTVRFATPKERDKWLKADRQYRRPDISSYKVTVWSRKPAVKESLTTAEGLPLHRGSTLLAKP